jgi:hypothetical protein
MSGLIAEFLEDGIPVKIVGDQIDAAQDEREDAAEMCPRCKEMPCKCGRGMMMEMDDGED